MWPTGRQIGKGLGLGLGLLRSWTQEYDKLSSIGGYVTINGNNALSVSEPFGNFLGTLVLP